MDGACSAHVGYEKCVQNSGTKAQRKEATLKTLAYMKG
jgi:hypothetical protein